MFYRKGLVTPETPMPMTEGDRGNGMPPHRNMDRYKDYHCQNISSFYVSFTVPFVIVCHIIA